MMRDRSVGFADLLTQQKITNRLLAAQLRGTMKQNELIALLSTTGASAQEIADVVNTTAATVQVTIHRLKKATGKGRNERHE
jgi:DNA-directed RNA polymerase specialized sigma24 family protein